MTLTLSTLITDFLMLLGGMGILFISVLRETFTTALNWGLLREQLFQIGYRSLPIAIVTAGSTGMVMTLQFGLGLERFGGTLYVPKIVTVSILREMGPVFTGLMIAARVGAGIASEIGSMVVTQQIDAIRAMGTSPIQKIVVPRVIACMIALPLLVGVANFVGFFGGLLIGATELGLDPQFYMLKAAGDLRLVDYFSGFGKTFFFALFISISSCYYGLNVKDGTKGVGMATTKAVVVSSIFVLIGDFFLTKLFWIFEKWI